jgi:hypothetical protein
MFFQQVEPRKALIIPANDRLRSLFPVTLRSQSGVNPEIHENQGYFLSGLVDSNRHEGKKKG